MFIIMCIAKLLMRALNLLHRGATTLPGRIALRLKPNILFALSTDVYCICVTGTNGKTTTCAMIEKGLIANNKPCFINKGGANMMSGVVTAFIKNATLFGKPRCKYAVLECDENSLPLITGSINAKIIVVTNVFRDQLDRYGEINTTLEKIRQGISNSPNAVVILNADCPVTYSLKFRCKNDVISFGVDCSSGVSVVSDSPLCPLCSAKLSYHSLIYAQLGSFYCPVCKYHRIKPDLLATDICNSSFNIGEKRINMSLGGIYNIYNFLSAAAVMEHLGLSYLPIQSFGGSFGRTESFYNGNNKITLMLVKNPVGFSSCINLAFTQYGIFNSIFALNDNDADGRDVSWIWDVSFGRVSSNKCYTIGTRAYDMAVRLKYDDVKAMVIENENYRQMIDTIICDNTDFVIFASYTAMMDMRHLLIESFGGDEFWQ